MAIDPDDITPSTDDVAKCIRARTIDSNGVKLGTFTDDTNPTAVEVGEYLSASARYIALELGTVYSQWDGDLNAVAADVVAVHAALKIETSYNGDGAGQDSTLMGQLGRQFREQLDALKATARDAQIGSNPIGSMRIIPAQRRTSGGA